ncbi:MAG: hypothetical protein Q8R45_08690 [Brevundimonas sp.]|uniref:hypothetical protein n=1 Tax=Brevundimonas sp. TaxID=1871086 RepID=UPI002716FC3C|nr:hypothetical protein [Brevundimonas sp.]MDO9587650.1 hypothetical protein [Brevundimonas sp.]MDP3657025.1 hypothetical protein [Brevundimonas sp.]
MIDAAQLQPLRDRRAQIAKRLGDLESRAAKIAREKDDLDREASAIDTTLETLAKVYGVEVDGEDVKPKHGVSTKPENTPTMFGMVETVLLEHALWGDDFLEGQVIYDEIRKRWWSDAPRNSVIPSLYRFEKEGRLVKLGTKYGLPQTNEAPGGQTPSASEPEWESDDPF